MKAVLVDKVFSDMYMINPHQIARIYNNSLTHFPKHLLFNFDAQFLLIQMI